MTLEEIKSKLDDLSPVKVSFVAKVIEALSNPASIKRPVCWNMADRKPRMDRVFRAGLVGSPRGYHRAIAADLVRDRLQERM